MLKDTRPKEFYQETLASLAYQQAVKRDELLTALLESKFERAKLKIENLQSIGIGIQACQATIERYDQFAKTNEAEAAAAAPQAKAELKEQV